MAFVIALYVMLGTFLTPSEIILVTVPVLLPGAQNTTEVDVPGNATSATVTDLLNGDSYTLEVRARNVVGLGDTATTATTVKPCGPPYQPLAVFVNGHN